MSKTNFKKVIKSIENFVSSGYAAASQNVIMRCKMLTKFQALPVVAYGLFILLLCTNSDWSF